MGKFKDLSDRGTIGFPQFINAEPYGFVAAQINIMESAQKNICRVISLDVFMKEQNLPFPFPHPINIEKDERLGVRQKVSGGQFFVVEDMNGGFKRIYNE